MKIRKLAISLTMWSMHITWSVVKWSDKNNQTTAVILRMKERNYKKKKNVETTIEWYIKIWQKKCMSMDAFRCVCTCTHARTHNHRHHVIHRHFFLPATVIICWLFCFFFYFVPANPVDSRFVLSCVVAINVFQWFSMQFWIAPVSFPPENKKNCCIHRFSYLCTLVANSNQSPISNWNPEIQ